MHEHDPGKNSGPRHGYMDGNINKKKEFSYVRLVAHISTSIVQQDIVRPNYHAVTVDGGLILYVNLVLRYLAVRSKSIFMQPAIRFQ